MSAVDVLSFANAIYMSILESAEIKVRRLQQTIEYYEKGLVQAREKLKRAEAHVVYVRKRYKCYANRSD